MGEADINKAAAGITKGLTSSKREEKAEQKKEQKKNADIAKEIRDIDITKLTPIEAINILYNLQEKLNN